MNLERIGFNQWFQERVDTTRLDTHQIARVVTVNKEKYLVRNDSIEVIAEITGKLLFRAESPLEYPAVGDWVYVQYFNDGSFAIIDEILPRKTILKRKTSGKRIEYQLIAANIDTAFIVQSLDSNYNLRRMERYLTMIYESDIRPIVLLSKSDLLTPTEVEVKLSEVHTLMRDIRIVAFSNLDLSGLDEIQRLLVSGETYCLLGSSGVGKTALLNNLVGKELLETQAVREKDGKGRHTTARRQLIILENGALLVDTPGMRELGNIGVESGLEQTFEEISELAGQCRYNDCSHTHEKGCAILAAVRDGALCRERYENYVKMSKESAYYEMSYRERRLRDRKFGKMCKSVVKRNRKK